MLSWLLWFPGKLERRFALLVLCASSMLAAPWYSAALGDVGNWRVTKGWLNIKPRGYRTIAVPFELVMNFFTNRPTERVVLPAMRGVMLAAVALLVVLWSVDRRIFSGRRALLWLWAGAACVGPMLFDLVGGTYTGAVTRYALAGMPAAFLIAATFVAGLPSWGRVLVLLCAVVGWSTGLWHIAMDVSRGTMPLREVARTLDAGSAAGDLIVVYSIRRGS